MICGKCIKNFTSGRMGVIVKMVRKVTKRNEKTKKDVVVEEASFRRGDECVCPGCGALVIAHFGESYEGETKTPDYVVDRQP